MRDLLENNLILFIQFSGILLPEIFVIVRRSPRELSRFKFRLVLVVSPVDVNELACSSLGRAPPRSIEDSGRYHHLQ